MRPPHTQDIRAWFVNAIEGLKSYVGNKIAVFSMQSLGCDVAALNTVQFSGFFSSCRDLTFVPAAARTGCSLCVLIMNSGRY